MSAAPRPTIASPRARRGSSRSAARCRRGRRARPRGRRPVARDGIAKRTESSGRPRRSLGDRGADRTRGSPPRRRSPTRCSTRSSVRAASRPSNPGSRWLAEPVTRGRGPADGQGRPRPRRPARPRRSGAPRRSRGARPRALRPGTGRTVVAGTSPASFAATATAHAPLPHAIVSPAPRSHTRASIPSGSHLGELHVRALGERLVAFERRPDVRDVEPVGVLVDEQHEMRVPHRDRARRQRRYPRPHRTAAEERLPRRPAHRDRRLREVGVAHLDGDPMHVSAVVVQFAAAGRRLGSPRRTRPRRQPRSCTSMPTHRTPLPHISATLPSALR